MHLVDRLTSVFGNKWQMARLSGDFTTFIRLHTLGRQAKVRKRVKSASQATPLCLRPLDTDTVWCRQGTSDIAALWEVFIAREYSIPADVTGPVRTVLDLGANVGYSMLYFAKQYPASRVVGVEPDRDNALLARRNTERLQQRCTVIEAAAWDRDTYVGICRDGPEYSFYVQEETMLLPASVEAFKVSTLMRMGGLEHVDLLKVDIEGAERAVFSTLKHWAHRVSCIICELHGDYSFEEFEKTLHTSGFASLRPAAVPGLKLPIAVRRV